MDSDLDPYLIAHRVGRGEFSMAGKYSPASVRDQMNRAVAIVERAWRNGVIDASTSLLVIGCGAAGVAAAMQAVKLGLSSVKLTTNGPFFDRQRRSSRIIDPVEYDWPAEGWLNGSIVSDRTPLPYVRGRAKQIVARYWDPAWRAFRKTHEGKELEILPAASTASADRTLVCTGPGDERTDTSNYKWFSFWQDDPLEHPRANLGRVLISGSGDGALQDFLRVLFPARTPRDIYQGLGLSPAQRLNLEWTIFNAEDRARRGWIWNADKAIDCIVLQELHNAHRAAAERIVALRDVKRNLSSLLANRTTDLNKVWLAHDCTHFSSCYAFNRFLVLLADEYCKSVLAGTRILPQRRLTGVEPNDGNAHQCDKSDIGACLEHSHDAELTAWTCNDSVERRSLTPETYDVVVIRHGLSGVAKRLSRQALPYVLPAMPV